MKKITILIFTLLISGGLFAQMPNFGIKVAATAASLNTSELAANIESNNLLGYQAGAFLRINTGKLYLQPEVVYNHRSTQLAGLSGGDVTFDLGTIDIPVLVGFKLLDAKVFNLRAFAGPEISFATGDATSSDDVTLADFNKKTWYMQAGVGVDLLFLTFDLRYEKGLSNFIEDYNNEGSLKNNVWVFSLGLKFM